MGGAAFILIYLVFLFVMGIPVLVTEFAVGRASRYSVAAVSYTHLKNGVHRSNVFYAY